MKEFLRPSIWYLSGISITGSTENLQQYFGQDWSEALWSVPPSDQYDWGSGQGCGRGLCCAGGKKVPSVRLQGHLLQWLQLSPPCHKGMSDDVQRRLRNAHRLSLLWSGEHGKFWRLSDYESTYIIVVALVLKYFPPYLLAPSSISKCGSDW